MSKTIELRAEMGSAVLSRLRRYGDLPTSGCVAGQAVASAVCDLYGGGYGGGVYNDVDVFRLVRRDTKDDGAKANHTATRVNPGSPTRTRDGQPVDDYGGLAGMLQVIESYGIHSVYRKGMINVVNCTLPLGPVSTLTPSRVITGFDLNCCHVAVDLSNQELVWDAHFARFVASKQLEIAMVHTPWHTFLRLCKKIEEIPGTYADLDAAAEICVGIVDSTFFNQMMVTKTVSTLFGAKHLELAQRFSKVLEPYFSLETEKWSKAGASWRREGSSDCEDHQSEKGSVHLSRLFPRGQLDDALQSKINRHGVAAVFSGPAAVYDARRTKSKQIYVKLEQLREATASHEHGNSIRKYIDVMGVAYVEGQALPTVAAMVNKFTTEHRGFFGKLVGLTLADQHKTIQRIKEVCKEFDGNASLGALEIQACGADLAHKHTMRSLLEFHRKRKEVPFAIQKLAIPRLPGQFDGYVVEELLSGLELEEESNQMNHCVGGYDSKVRSNLCRILRIRPRGISDKTTWSTAEVVAEDRGARLGPKARLQLVQHRGPRNKEPHPTNVEVLEAVISLHGLGRGAQALLFSPVGRHVANALLQIAKLRCFVVRGVADTLLKAYQRTTEAHLASKLQIERSTTRMAMLRSHLTSATEPE